MLYVVPRSATPRINLAWIKRSRKLQISRYVLEIMYLLNTHWEIRRLLASTDGWIGNVESFYREVKSPNHVLSIFFRIIKLFFRSDAISTADRLFFLRHHGTDLLLLWCYKITQLDSMTKHQQHQQQPHLLSINSWKTARSCNCLHPSRVWGIITENILHVTIKLVMNCICAVPRGQYAKTGSEYLSNLWLTPTWFCFVHFRTGRDVRKKGAWLDYL